MLLSSNITHRGWQTQSIETGQPFSHSLHCSLPAFRNSGPETRQCSALHTGPSQPTVFISVKPAAKIFVIASLMPNEPCKYARFVKRSWSTWKVEVFVVVSLPSFLPYFRGVFLFVLVGFFLVLFSLLWSSKAGSNLQNLQFKRYAHTYVPVHANKPEKSASLFQGMKFHRRILDSVLKSQKRLFTGLS